MHKYKYSQMVVCIKKNCLGSVHLPLTYEIVLCIYHMKNTISVLTCVSGKLLSDVALSFSQMRLFSEASECYEQALPLVSSKPHRLAVVLQNLGAVYNSLGQYQQSLRYHREAAALHGETHTSDTKQT